MLLGANNGSEVGEYFANWNGVGQFAEETRVTSEAVQLPQPRIELDLRDAEAARQMKVAMAMSPHMLPFIFGDDADPDFDEQFFDDPVWGRLSTKFARIWIEGFKDAFPSIPDADSMFVSPHLYPKSAGALMTLFTLGYRMPGAAPSVDFSQLNKLTEFFDETGGNPQKGVVLAPFVSREEQGSSAVPVKASTIAYVGLGLLGIVALGVVLGGQKRRR